MKNKVLFLVFVFLFLSLNAQDAQETLQQKPLKNTGITIYPLGISFLKSNQFQKSLQEKGIDVDIPKVLACMSFKVTPIALGDFGLLSFDAGIEGNNRKEKDYYTRLFAIFGTTECLFPIVNEKKIRVFSSVGMEYSFTKFEYYTIDNNPISLQDLFTVKDGSINLSQNNQFSAFLGVYFNYFFFEKQGISIFAKYRIPLDKNNRNWKVANTDRTVTHLEKYIPNYFLMGVGYVFGL
jgi:hypothetical protein